MTYEIYNCCKHSLRFFEQNEDRYMQDYSFIVTIEAENPEHAIILLQGNTAEWAQSEANQQQSERCSFLSNHERKA